MEAKKAAPAGKKATKADMALSYIGKLYGIERQAKGLQPQQRQRLRQSHSVPLLHELRAWLDKTLQSR